MVWPPRTLVVPIDFSDGSREALRVARERAGGEGRIELIYVLEHLSALHPAAVFEEEDDAERLEHAEQALHKLAREEGLEHYGVTTATTFGNPAATVAQFADGRDADLLVLCSHGRTGLARVAIGSVAERVVRYAKCPVLVIKPPPADEA